MNRTDTQRIQPSIDAAHSPCREARFSIGNPFARLAAVAAIGIGGAAKLSSGADGGAPGSIPNDFTQSSLNKAGMPRLDVQGTAKFGESYIGQIPFGNFKEDGFGTHYRTIEVHSSDKKEILSHGPLLAREAEVKVTSITPDFSNIVLNSWVAIPQRYWKPIIDLADRAGRPKEDNTSVHSVPVLHVAAQLIDANTNMSLGWGESGPTKDQVKAALHFVRTPEQAKAIKAGLDAGTITIRYHVLARKEGGEFARAERISSQSVVSSVLQEFETKNREEKIPGFTANQRNEIAQTIAARVETRLTGSSVELIKTVSTQLQNPAFIQATFREQQTIKLSSLPEQAQAAAVERLRPLINETLTAEEKLNVTTNTDQKSHTEITSGSGGVGLVGKMLKFGAGVDVTTIDQTLKRLEKQTGTKWAKTEVEREYVLEDITLYTADAATLSAGVDERVFVELVKPVNGYQMIDVPSSWTTDLFASLASSLAVDVNHREQAEMLLAQREELLTRLDAIEYELADQKATTVTIHESLARLQTDTANAVDWFNSIHKDVADSHLNKLFWEWVKEERAPWSGNWGYELRPDNARHGLQFARVKDIHGDKIAIESETQLDGFRAKVSDHFHFLFKDLKDKTTNFGWEEAIEAFQVYGLDKEESSNLKSTLIDQISSSAYKALYGVDFNDPPVIAPIPSLESTKR